MPSLHQYLLQESKTSNKESKKSTKENKTSKKESKKSSKEKKTSKKESKKIIKEESTPEDVTYPDWSESDDELLKKPKKK